jgi:hypothetical protein
MSALPIDIPFDSAAEWLVQRKLVSSSYAKSLRAVHAKLAAALAEERPPVAAAAALVPAGAPRESVTYFDCVRLMAALKEAGLAEKNFLGQYTDAHASRWGEVVRRYESGCAFLADAAAFLVQQVGYELPALKAEAVRAQRELSELQRRQGEYVRLASAARDRFVAACEKRKLSGDCGRDEIGRRLRESRAQLRGTYAQVAALCQGNPMVEAVRLYCDFVSHCLGVAARFGDTGGAEGGAEGGEGGEEAATKGKEGKAKGGKGAKAKPGGGGGGGGGVASAAVADASAVAEDSLPVLKLVQALDASPLLNDTRGGEGAAGGENFAGGGDTAGGGVDWGAEAGGGEATAVIWGITAGDDTRGEDAPVAAGGADTGGGPAVEVAWEGDTGDEPAAEVDWGISAGAGGGGEVDWGGCEEWAGVIEVEEADTGGGGTLFDVFEDGEKRDALLDDLHEMDGFLAQRMEQVGKGAGWGRGRGEQGGTALKQNGSSTWEQTRAAPSWPLSALPLPSFTAASCIPSLIPACAGGNQSLPFTTHTPTRPLLPPPFPSVQVGAGGNQGLPNALQLDASEIASRLDTVREVTTTHALGPPHTPFHNTLPQGTPQC